LRKRGHAVSHSKSSNTVDALCFDQSRALILAVIAAIPRGAVMSYGAVAAAAGLPKRARLVARVLGNLASGEDLPWFRVIRSDNRIAFPPGSDGFRRQAGKLRSEGCRVDDNGRVQPKITAALSLDAQLWGGFFSGDA